MGVCYGEEEEWKEVRRKKIIKRTKYRSSIIYEQKSVYESSFAASHFEYREDMKGTMEEYKNQSLKQDQVESLQRALSAKAMSSQAHCITDPFTLNNLKTNKCLHTHRVRIPQCKKIQEISACPFDSNHMIEYDIWKLIRAEEPSTSQNNINHSEFEDQMQQGYYIYHPFTQKFMSVFKGKIVASDSKMVWSIKSMGDRRHGGYIKIYCKDGEVCMSTQKGLLQGHRAMYLCKENHLSHFWELNCSEIL